jgi:hypothetical protein
MGQQHAGGRAVDGERRRTWRDGRAAVARALRRQVGTTHAGGGRREAPGCALGPRAAALAGGRRAWRSGGQ